MKQYPATLRAVLRSSAKAAGALDVLVEIDDPAAPIRRVLSSGPRVEWPPASGIYYYPAVGAFSLLSDNLDGRRPQVTLTMSNVRDPEDEVTDLPWSKWLRANNPNGREVTFRFVATNTGDATAEIVARRWYVSGINSLTHLAAAFHLGSPHDALAASVPRVSLAARKCWALVYKQGFCTSTSSLPTCDRSFESCVPRFPNAIRKFAPGFPMFTDARRRGVS